MFESLNKELHGREKLLKKSELIGWGGTGVAVTLFIILTIGWALGNRKNPARNIVNFFITTLQ